MSALLASFTDCIEPQRLNLVLRSQNSLDRNRAHSQDGWRYKDQFCLTALSAVLPGFEAHASKRAYEMEDLSKTVNGYPKLAARFALVPETAHYRTFAALAHRELLYYQAELVQLEDKLCELELADSQSPEEQRCRYARDWAFLDLSHLGNHGEQRQTVLRIRDLLPRYCTLILPRCLFEAENKSDQALRDQMFLANQPEPQSFDKRYNQNWLNDPNHGAMTLVGPDRKVYGLTMNNPDSSATDLIAIKPRADEDTFSNWVTRDFILWFHNWLGKWVTKPSSKYNECGYYEDTLLRCTHLITTVIASLLLICPIAVLDKVSSMNKRLGLIACFSLLFALGMHLLTRAKRSDVFTAIAGQV